MVTPAAGGNVTHSSYWDAIFELGFDPENGRVSDEHACRRIETVYGFNQLLSDRVETDRELASTYGDLRAMLSSLDAGNLYELMPFSDPDGLKRAIGIGGRSQKNLYRLHLYDPGAGQDWDFGDHAERRVPDNLYHFGDFDFRTFIKPVSKSRFRFFSDLRINMDDLSAVIIPRMLTAILTVVSQHAAAVDPPPAYLTHKFSLNQASLKVMAGLVHDFPDFLATITQYFEIENIVSTISPADEGAQNIDLRVRIKRHAFAKHYPEIGAMLERIDGLVFINGRIFNNQDRLMGYIELDSARDLFGLQYRILKGRFLPLDGSRSAGNPAGISLIAPSLSQFYAEFDIHLDMVGLNLHVSSLQVPIDYFLGGPELQLKTCLLQPPDDIKAGGRAFGFLPLWLIDILIPSNVEKITHDFFQAIATANNGNGSMFEVEGLRRESTNYLLIGTGAEVLANGTIKLGFNLQRWIAGDQQELISEIRAFNTELWQAFYRDYQKAKMKRGCQ
jgi:hypothetical protein